MFLEDKLSGDESVEVLIHLEDCDQCCRLLPREDPQEVLGKLLSDDTEDGPDQMIAEKQSD